MKYNQKKKKENIEIFLFIMVMAVFAAVLGVMSLGEKMQPVNQIRKISSGCESAVDIIAARIPQRKIPPINGSPR